MTGATLGEGVAVDTHSTPRVNFTDKTEVSNVAEFNEVLLASGKPQACFARHYFRFTFGRIEDVINNSDDCALAELQTKLLDGEGLGSVMRSIALRPEFKTRTFD
jgi:hypothetical protein